MANWSDTEIRELLALRPEAEVTRQFTGTANPIALSSKTDAESPETPSCSPPDEPAAAADGTDQQSVEDDKSVAAHDRISKMKRSQPPPRKRIRTRRRDVLDQMRDFLRAEQVEAERERVRWEQDRAAEEQWRRETALARQQQLDAIHRTQQLIERHWNLMESLLLQQNQNNDSQRHHHNS